MSKPFDATLKDLGSAYPADHLTAFDRAPSGPIAPMNVDLSTVTTAADLVLGVGDPLEEIIHIDFQGSNDRYKGSDTLVYNGLLYRHYEVPVHSIVVLLRPAAAHSRVNGTVGYAARPGRGKMEFGYEIVRLWERPAEELLNGPLGVAPLAVLGALPEGVELTEGLRGIAHRLIQRFEREELEPRRVELLVMSAFLLTGLIVRRDVAKQVFAGVKVMHESDTYLAIMDEGREAQTRRLIRRIAARKLGEPDEPSITRLEGITDVDRLERIHDCAVDAKVNSWRELLETP